MNKKLILAFSAAAVTLAACGPFPAGVTVWRNETAIVTKNTWTQVSDEEDRKLDAEIVRYRYADSIFVSNYQVYLCGGGFCDLHGEVIAESGSSESLDEKNERAYRTLWLHEDLASKVPLEVDADGGG